MGVFFTAYTNVVPLEPETIDAIEIDDIRYKGSEERISNAAHFTFLEGFPLQSMFFKHEYFLFERADQTSTWTYAWYSYWCDRIGELVGYKQNDPFSPLYLLLNFSKAEGSLDNHACRTIHAQLEQVNYTALSDYGQKFYHELLGVFKVADQENGIVSLQ